jgi:hypothetical protein
VRSFPEDQLIEVAPRAGNLRQQAEQRGRGSQRYRLEGLEADKTALRHLRLLENLPEQAALAGAGLASDEGRSWQPCSMSPPLQLREPIELILSANERLVHRLSLPQGQVVIYRQPAGRRPDRR